MAYFWHQSSHNSVKKVSVSSASVSLSLVSSTESTGTEADRTTEQVTSAVKSKLRRRAGQKRTKGIVAFTRCVWNQFVRLYHSLFLFGLSSSATLALVEPLFFPMLCVIPSECPFWPPPNSCIDRRVCEVGGGLEGFRGCSGVDWCV